MTALYIILGIIAAIITVLVILLHISVKAYIEADKSKVKVLVKYLGFELYRLEVPDKSKNEDKHRETEKIEPKSGSEDKGEEPEIVLTEVQAVDSTDDAEREEILKKMSETPKKESPSDKETAADKTDENKAKESDEDSEKKTGPSLLDKFDEYKKYIPAAKKAFRKLLKLIRFYDLDFSLTVGNDNPYKAGLNFGRLNAVLYSALGLLCTVFSVKIKHTEIKCDFERKTTDFSFSTAVYVRPSAVLALLIYLGIYYLKIKKSMKKLEKTAIAKEKLS